MKRMIDNKEFNKLKKDVDDISEVVEEHTTDYVITSVVVEENKVLGSQVKDVENDVTYNLPLGSQVVANPTLEGGESTLESIEIDGTKYGIGGGKQLYQHNISGKTSYGYHFYMEITNDDDTAINTYNQIKDYLYNNGFTTNASKYYGKVNGIAPADSTYYIVDSVVYNSSTQKAICRMYKLNSTSAEDFSLDNAMWGFSDVVIPL